MVRLYEIFAKKVTLLCKGPQNAVHLKLDGITAAKSLSEIINLRCGKAAVSPQGDHNIRILFQKLTQQRGKEKVCVAAAVFRSMTELYLEKVARQAVKA